ncbi:MAG: hypothetical protein R6V51_01175 [Dehalococcoidia bacterium]
MTSHTDYGKGMADDLTLRPGADRKHSTGFTAEERDRYIRELEASRDPAYENTSGQGNLAVIPDGVRGWNWGAFSLTWIWGASNSVWISFLAFIPYFGILWSIVLGVKGNEWAWRSKKWNSVDAFRNTQDKWNTAGIIVFVVAILISFFAFAYW